ncbi:MAG: hypothetical protein IPK97_10425 [Ahniella sp.]|nr:hypothetical protein [Ahniella sp.]
MFLEFLKFDLRFNGARLCCGSGSAYLRCLHSRPRPVMPQIGGSIGNVHRNAPFVIIQFLNVFTILGLFISVFCRRRVVATSK